MKRINGGLSSNFSENERGAALLLVLFVTSLLIIIAAEFTFTTRMELEATLNFKEDLEGYYYALAGYQYALTEIIGKFDDTYISEEGQTGFYRKWYHEDPEKNLEYKDEEEPNWPPLPPRKGITVGGGAFDYIITDEQGRLNLNKLSTRKMRGSTKTSRQIFKELLLASGVEDGEKPDIIIDSIMDWIDPGDEHRLNGAEDDWYQHNYKEQGFSESYHCKNGKISTVEEVLLIRGMTPAILYGSNSIYASFQEEEEEYMGILPYITVYGYHSVINKLTAPPLLLQIMDPDNVEQDLEDRNDPDARKRKNPSKTFRIEVKGYKQGSRISHNLVAVIRRAQRPKIGGAVDVLYWNDDALVFGTDLTSYQHDINTSEMEGMF